MELPLSRRFGTAGRPLARARAGPLLALVVAGLLAEVVNHEDAYAGLDYGLSLLALLGATGCIVTLTGRLASGLNPLPWATPLSPVPASSAPPSGRPAGGKDWPLLVSLLFGAIFVLLSGLGGWV